MAKELTPLDVLKKRAKQEGLPEPICDNCVSFNAKCREDDMGTCERRDGEQQFRFGLCLSHIHVR